MLLQKGQGFQGVEKIYGVKNGTKSQKMFQKVGARGLKVDLASSLSLTKLNNNIFKVEQLCY